MTEELLLGCFEGLRTNAASGIDGVTKEQYARQSGGEPARVSRQTPSDGVHPATGGKGLHPQAGKCQATAIGNPRTGRQTRPGRTGKNPASDL